MLQIENFKSVMNQNAAAPDVSHRYTFVPTTRVLDVLAGHGWLPSTIRETNVRLEEKQGFQKHIIRLRNPEYSALISNHHPEIILKNAHDRSGVFELSLGIWRKICSNGLCAPVDYGMEKIRHIGFATDKVEEAVNNLAYLAPKLLQTVDVLNTVVLSTDEQLAFAKSAIELKYDKDEDSFLLEPSAVNTHRRYADAASDLWSTFNRVQENLIKGGVRGRTTDNKRRRDRAVNSIDRNLSLNRALWTLTEEMARIKGVSIN